MPTDPLILEPDDARERRLVEERRDRLGAQLVQGWSSGLARSAVVIFLIGLGQAPRIEDSLRPNDYPSTRTARNDRIIAAATITLIVLACLLVRYPLKK